MQHNRSPQLHRPDRFGFTLVELLVAVALVLTIMLLLAQVFDVAASTARKQRGTAENDQQARTFTILIKQDLANMTFVDVVPFYPRDPTVAAADDVCRRGYFYYAENDPDDQTDDVLAFTVATFNFCEDVETGQLPYQGAAKVLVDPNVGTNGVDDDFDGTVDEADESDPANYLRFHPNQPEGDDGIVNTSGSPSNPSSPTATDINGNLNGIGMSTAAEIVYFMRGGNLYRRVMLIRDPYDDSPQVVPPSPPPYDYTSSINPNTFITADYPGGYSPVGSGEFWRDFDYSAYNFYVDNGSDPVISNGPRFNTVLSLINDGSNPREALGAYEITTSLGAPHRRFGHNPFGLLGLPREFVDPAGGGTEEDANRNGLLDAGEDLNGNNQLDDEFMGRFLAQETAHSAFNYPGVATTGVNNPYTRGNLRLDTTTRLVTTYGTEYYKRAEDLLLTNVIEFDVKLLDDGLSTPAFVDLGHTRTEDVDGDGIVDLGEDLNLDGDVTDAVGFYHRSKNLNPAYGNRFDTWYALSIRDYDPTNPTPAERVQAPPYRPYSPGPDGAPGIAGRDDDYFGIDDNGDTVIDDPAEVDDPAELGYPGSDDIPYPLKAIQITVRYMDPGNDLIRQVTIIESFVAVEDF